MSTFLEDAVNHGEHGERQGNSGRPVVFSALTPNPASLGLFKTFPVFPVPSVVKQAFHESADYPMRPLLLSLLLAFATCVRADVIVRDDAGQTVRLNAPAQRIVSLAPHITELLYAAGAGSRLVGAVEYSDFPEAAKKLPRLGGYERIDLEALLALKPDLVIGWQSGTPAAQIDKIRALGLVVFLSQPNKIGDVAVDLERYGQLAGTTAVAAPAAAAFRQRLATLRARYSARPTVRVFYEVWNQPLMTVGGSQIISDVLRLCGGENVFVQLNSMAPTVSVEAVLAANPEAIVAAGMGDARPEWLDDWKKWPRLTAAQRGNLFHIHPDLMHRHTPRLLDGSEQLCRHLETARSRRR